MPTPLPPGSLAHGPGRSAIAIAALLCPIGCASTPEDRGSNPDDAGGEPSHASVLVLRRTGGV